MITGGAMLLLFFMVVLDSGMPGYFGCSVSDTNWYDNWAHLVGVFGMTMLLWSFLCWAPGSDRPRGGNGTRRFVLVIGTMVAVSFLFDFIEFLTDALFGWTNFHPGTDTVGDLTFDLAGVTIGGLVISRHGASLLSRPFWQDRPIPAGR